MANQKLIEYIKKQLSRNKTDDEIIKTLKGVGWDYADITEAMSIVKKQTKHKKLIVRYMLSVVIIAALFLTLEIINDFYQHQEYSFKTSEKISILGSSNTDRNQSINNNQNAEDISYICNNDIMCLSNLLDSCFGKANFEVDSPENISIKYHYSLNLNFKGFDSNLCVFEARYDNFSYEIVNNTNLNQEEVNFIEQKLSNIDKGKWLCKLDLNVLKEGIINSLASNDIIFFEGLSCTLK